MPLHAARPRFLTTAALLLAAALGVTGVLSAANAQTAAKAKGPPVRAVPAKAEGEAEGGAAKASQAIVVLVNDEPITAWEIEQRAAFIAANGGGGAPPEMKAKAEARWQAIVKDPKTNERFQQLLREKGVSSQQEAQALQQQFVQKLQMDMIEGLKREMRSSMLGQYRKKAQDELIDERLKVQEAKKLGLEISEDDLKALLKGLAERNKMTIEQFSAHTKSAGFDISTMREKFRAEKAWAELIRRRYGGQISVNQKDVERLLTAAATESGEDAVELQVQKITLAVPRADQPSLVRRYSEAQALQSKFDGCKNMAGLAKDAGGSFEDMKFVKPSNLPEPTRSLMLVARDGDMLPPATLANSIEIYAVCGRRTIKGDEKQRDKAMQELQAREFEIVAKKRLFDLRQEAHIEIR